jgi:hypothetical protein
MLNRYITDAIRRYLLLTQYVNTLNQNKLSKNIFNKIEMFRSGFAPESQPELYD